MSQILKPIATVSESSDCLYPSVQHLVTMLDDDGNEIVLWVWTETNSFCDVLRECKRVIAVAWLDEGLDYRGYRFYESFEVVDRPVQRQIAGVSPQLNGDRTLVA